jgi:urease accessory protein
MRISDPAARLSVAILAAGLAPDMALAHGDNMGGGFASGFAHPILGWDHVAAMVAVGMWGALLGRPSLWILPVAFPLLMAGGSALGILGIPLPAVETGIAVSAIVLGGLILLSVKAPFPIAVVLVGVFAIFHGYAHGAELPDLANPFVFASGFVIATGLLHLFGIAFGLLIAWPVGRLAVRAGGGAIAATGAGFLFGLV